ncbi:response regulator [Kocuria nitroreducens]|uniref:response regulator n=1 Tax=Kocuria nitroreducens TaxID=3058914 RepID=UPI0036DF75E0
MDHIWLIEDEASISDPLAFLLRRSGFEVTVIDNGVDAIRAFDPSVVDLILLDLQLPGIPGMHLCRQLRQRCEVPIIMLTARDTEMDTVAGLEAGADDYVTKPFASGELIARMRAVLRRHQPPELIPSTVLGCARVRMDLYAHQVSVGGAPVSLPLKTFQLLEVLLRSPGRVLTRGELIDQVWGADSGIESKAVDTQMARLRHMLEIDPADPQHLRTVRGLGYVYDP